MEELFRGFLLRGFSLFGNLQPAAAQLSTARERSHITPMDEAPGLGSLWGGGGSGGKGGCMQLLRSYYSALSTGRPIDGQTSQNLIIYWVLRGLPVDRCARR